MTDTTWALPETNYTPTVFTERTCAATKAIQEWIAERESAGYTVSFCVGELACSEDQLLSCYWYAQRSTRIGTMCGGCMNLAGKPFRFA